MAASPPATLSAALGRFVDRLADALFRPDTDTERVLEAMKELAEHIAAASEAADKAIARVQKDVEALNAKVDTLQKRIDEGNATPEDIAALDALRAKLDALDPASPVTLPDGGADEPPPAPEVRP